jgi:ABC-type multidrug transport system fused ATPase/permease subunit
MLSKTFGRTTSFPLPIRDGRRHAARALAAAVAIVAAFSGLQASAQTVTISGTTTLTRLIFWRRSTMYWRRMSKWLLMGNVMITFFSVIFGGLNLGQAVPGLSALASARTALFKILKTIRLISPIDPLSQEGATIENVQGEIEFRKVTFTYPQRPEQPVYQSIDMMFPAGKTVALVGPSGCGKSTAVALVERFYDVCGEGGDFGDV